MDIFTSYDHIKGENKNTDLLMILAWLCRFKYILSTWKLWVAASPSRD